jgi:gas vesicle protein
VNNWWSNNWDKVATLVLGGIVGFFTAVIATNQAISTLNERVAKIETKAQTQYDPGYQKINEINLKMIGLENDLKNLKDQQLLTDKLIELHIDKFQVELEKVRKDTINVLTKFVVESKKKP